MWWNKRIKRQINYDYLTYHVKDDTFKRRFDDFNNGIEPF